MNSLGRLSLVFLSICLFFGFGFAGYLWIDAPSTVYEGCYQPYIIKMNSSGTQTAAVDTKLFLSGYFSISYPYLNLADLVPGSSGPASYEEGIFTTTALATGLSTSGVVIGGEYFYINTYNSPYALTGGEGLSLITLYLRPNDYATGYLNFYFAAANWNGDDSNISSGYNSGTQYADALEAVVDGVYTINTGNDCNYKPYATGATYRFTGYFRTSTGYQAVWTSMIAGPIYGCTDPLFCTYTNSTGWTYWTKDPVLLTLFGATDPLSAFSLSGIQFLPISVLDGTYPISYTGTNLNTGWYAYRELIFTGDVLTGYLVFTNIIGNTGNTYFSGTAYDSILYVNMFWLDTVKPDDDRFFTGYLYASGGAGSGGYQTFLLSVGTGSYGVSDATNGWHSDTSIKDDEFMIIGFSGYNEITQYEYADDSSTEYMEWLNSTGYIWSGVNDFATGHYLTFNSPWSGWVYFIDRAGNTGEFFLDSTPEVSLTYTFKVWPQQVNLSSGNPIYRQLLSGMLIKVAIYTGFDYETYSGAIDTIKNQLVLENIVYTGFLKTNALGEAELSGINLGNFVGDVLVEGAFTLAGIMTGVTFDQNGGDMDFTIPYHSGLAMGNFFNHSDSIGSLFGRDIIVFSGNQFLHADYASNAVNGSKNDSIQVADIAVLVTVLGEFSKYPLGTNDAAIFTGSNFFIDAPELGSYFVPNSVKSTLVNEMQYHPYDLNSDGDVSSADFGIAASNIGIITYKMPF